MIRSTTWPCWNASPGAFDFDRPLKHWDLPESILTLRRLKADEGFNGARAFIRCRSTAFRQPGHY